MSRPHRPDPYGSRCVRCGLSDRVAWVFGRLNVRCSRRIAARYMRRYETEGRHYRRYLAGHAERWSDIGQRALVAAEGAQELASILGLAAALQTPPRAP